MAMKLPPALMSLLGAIVALVFRLWELTLRKDHHGRDSIQTARDQGERFVFALWHDELFCTAMLRKGRPLVTIVSQSGDGEILAQILERLGMLCARGSSSRGGLKALVAVIKAMRQGRDVVITVDGPRGPRHEVKDGIIYLAHKTKTRIVPVRAFPSRAHVFHKAWDRFQLPLPFSHVRYCWGEPYAVSADKLDEAALEQEKHRLKERLDALG